MGIINDIKIEIPIDGEVEVLTFSKEDNLNNVNNTNERYISRQGLILRAIINDKAFCYNVERIDKENILREHTEKITEVFTDQYNEAVILINENLESGIESTQDDLNEDPSITMPYDPNSVRVTQGRFSLREIYEMINGTEYDESILDLSPDFQRNYVWDNTRKSRLIESILLKIPLPVFYLARTKDGKYQVVDGVQRLSVINEFFSNGFKLRNLEYLKEECDQKYFHKENASSLHPKFVRHLRSYQIDCNIIEPDTPFRVKSDIFKRLNTGGRSLNNQEIRNSILRKESRNFIRELANSEEFKLATNNSIKPKRMMDQELVIRYIGFYFIYKQSNWFPGLRYSSIMDEFLDNVVEILNNDFKKVPFPIIEQDFKLAMNNAFDMFGDYAFRKVNIDYENHPKIMINKSLFTAFSVLLSNYDKDIIQKKGNVTKDFAKWLKAEERLFESITYGTNDRARIDTTFILIEKFLNLLYGENK